MGAAAEKKPSLAVLIGMKKPDSADDDDEDKSASEGDDGKAYKAAGETLRDAVKAGDGDAIASAVCAIFDLHESHKSHKDEGEDEEKGEEY